MRANLGFKLSNFTHMYVYNFRQTIQIIKRCFGLTCCSVGLILVQRIKPKSVWGNTFKGNNFSVSPKGGGNRGARGSLMPPFNYSGGARPL